MRINKVSIWVGQATNEEALDDYMTLAYLEDGTVISDFAKDFKIGYYDEDFQEAYNSDVYEDVYVLITPLSYSSSFIDQLPKVSGVYNSVIALYYYEYSGDVVSQGAFRFIGTFDFEEIE